MADAVAVYNAVVGSTSQDPSVMQEASAQLAQWQIQPGFHATLQAIFTPGAGIEVGFLLFLWELLRTAIPPNFFDTTSTRPPPPFVLAARMRWRV